MSETLFDMDEEDKNNEDKDPLDIKERLFVQKYAENLIHGVKAPKMRAYCYAYYDGADIDELQVNERGDPRHGIKASMTPKWRLIEKKLGFERLAHDLELDNFSLLNKLKSLMETQRPMMRKTKTGDQEVVLYADGPTQLKATETLIRLANQLSVDPDKKETNTLKVVFSAEQDWSNVEVSKGKEEDELV